ncbi:MAG: MBOAT family protein [Candidatus Chisholmbacteria bacterium]|nr:MBOAT family protein [Candidatus Chisholmbacteria bacterium]
MIFTGSTYYLLLILSVCIFFVVPRRFRHWALALSGVVFYGDVAPAFLGLLSIELILVYLFLKFARHRGAIIALMGTLAVLGYFKYRGFFALTINQIGKLFTVGIGLPIGQVAVPLALSFVSFEFIHFIVEYRRGGIRELSFQKLASFIFFFPTLVSGPIKRFPAYSHQVSPAHLTAENIFIGGYRIILGLFKKIVLADTFAVLVGSTFDSIGTVTAATPSLLWLSLISFSFQIYLDFSGYSDIAIGSARLFGIIIPENFILPYFRRNIAEFWQHWHITLYRWIVDYIFIPLGGSRKGLTTTIRNTFIAMGLSGLWHGSQWHFVVWGLYHGVLLVGYRGYKLAIPENRFVHLKPLVSIMSVVVTFFLVTIGWLLFIAPVDVAIFSLKKMFGFA